ncbi:hypothetical protein DFJ73DRAFT_663279 [Zopfochytrium polystomum]|nr:hypothetical protein DFJ73DRAFT_663279 [Zopfochytrium polystomum]
MAEPDPPAAATDAGGPRVKFKVAFKSTVYEMDLPATAPVAILKQELEKKTGIDSNLQKLLFKGVLKDDQSLSDAKVTEGCKIILMASAAKDIINIVATPTNSTSSTASSPSAASAAPAYILDAPEHKRIIERGPPESVEKGLVGVKSAIPALGIPNLVNVRRIKTRLSFLATDELQIATGELTQKIPYSSISKVISEPIKGHDGYHAVGIQIGPTEKSLAWFYWVPSQVRSNVGH